MILVLNCGSQSIKWKIFSAEGETSPLRGGDLSLVKKGSREVLNSAEFENILHDELSKMGQGINLIGHRVVHGGGIFTKPIKITDENLPELEKLNHLAPLHNPYNVLGIKICQKIFTGVKNIAVFDTEFFKDLPEKAFTYALPQNFNFRRFGFHGISHEYVTRRACEILEEQAKKVHPVKYRKAVISASPRLFDRVKIITVHLGGGASIAAIKNGKAVDTSMGFTPQEGLVMMTRPGNIDAGIVLELAKEFGIEETSKILNKESGIKGICEEGEMLKVLARTESPEEPQRRRAELALDVFVYSIQKYIGAYFAVLGGCDVLVFTGAIGAGSAKIRNMIFKDLKILKIKKVLAIETDEELAIATKILNF